MTSPAVRRGGPAARRARGGRALALGQWAHVWIFFSEPGAAATPAPCVGRADRGHGTATEHRAQLVRPAVPEPGRAAERRVRKPDRAAAAARRARAGCSVFVDDELLPFADQWGTSPASSGSSSERLAALVAAASRRAGGILGVADESEHPDEPWRARSQELPISVPCHRRYGRSSPNRSTSSAQVSRRGSTTGSAARRLCEPRVLRAAAAPPVDGARAAAGGLRRGARAARGPAAGLSRRPRDPSLQPVPACDDRPPHERRTRRRAFAGTLTREQQAAVDGSRGTRSASSWRRRRG